MPKNIRRIIEKSRQIEPDMHTSVYIIDWGCVSTRLLCIQRMYLEAQCSPHIKAQYNREKEIRPVYI
jgi:hypothetical protein